MAYKEKEVQDVIDKLNVAQTLHAKVQAVQAAGKLVIDDSDDLSITSNQQVQDYLQSLKQKRDNKIAAAQTIVAAWAP